MKRNYEELFQAGNKAQLEKLHENEHKDGFDNIDIDYAYIRLEVEMDELLKELLLFPSSKDRKKAYEKIRHEAADIANYAYMIILKCDKEIAKLWYL